MIFFENVLDELTAKILVTDENLDILFINKSAEDYLCTSLDESKGKNIDQVFKEKTSNEIELQEILEEIIRIPAISFDVQRIPVSYRKNKI